MPFPSWIKIENLIRNLNLSGWFKRENSPVDKRHTETTVNIGKVEQHVQQIIVTHDKLPELLEQGEQSLIQLRQPKSLLPSSLSDSIIVGADVIEEDKKTVNARIDESIALLNLGRIDEARTSLFTLLGEIKNKQVFIKEQARVYNNLGVVYNRISPDSNYDKAIEYFDAALKIDASFVKAKMNLASTNINKGTPESIKKGYDLIKALWEIEKTSDILQTLLWGIYKLSGTEEVFKFVNAEAKNTRSLIEGKDTLLNLLAVLHLETGNFKESLNYSDKVLIISPNEPEFLEIKARGLLVRAQQNNQIPSEFDIIPRFSDYEDVRKALDLFMRAEEIADAQKKPYLLTEIRYGISISLIWLGKYDESKHKLKQLETAPDLPELLAHQVNVLNFAGYLHDREFEIAHKTLVTSAGYPKLGYEEKRRIGRIFLLNGAPEQAKLIFDEIVIAAEQKDDVYYWFDLGATCVLLGKQQEAISAATKVKKISEGTDNELRKIALSHYNAINYHYSKPEDGENSETGRLISGMMEFQKEFPEEKILTSFKALDGQGQLTEEIKDIFTSMKDRYENIKKTFKDNPIPIYYIEKIFHRSFASEISSRNDPDFTIEFNAVDPATIEELSKNFSKSESFAFDYLSLLDLAKMDFLGFLEKLDKPIFIHEKLFQKVQEELLQNEIDELRNLWNFLRKSKVVKIIKDKTDIKLDLKKLDDIFDEWLVETIKYAKAQNATLVTNDFRLYRFLKSEQIKPINVMPILKFWLEKNFIDEKMFSRALGDLAERFYTFLSFRGDDLFEIVMEDKGKITPRSYHLTREIFLPGSDIESFTNVFAQFINLFWRTGSLSEEKVNWVRFITNIITKIIDDNFLPLKNKTINEIDVVAINKKLNPIISHLAVIWRIATKSGTKDDLIELEKIINETLNKEYVAKSKEAIRAQIIKRIAELKTSQ